MNTYYYERTDTGSYSICKRVPQHPNGYIHLQYEYTLEDAKRHVRLLNEAEERERKS